MKTRYMELSDEYEYGQWPERIHATQGDNTKLYLPKHTADTTETLELKQSELWPDELCVINGKQIKKYALDETERDAHNKHNERDAPNKAPNTSKPANHDTRGMLHELNRLKLENEQLRTLYRQRIENEQLHELCDRLIEYINEDRCEGCACKSRCHDGMMDECWQLTDIRKLAAELGMAVN